MLVMSQFQIWLCSVCSKRRKAVLSNEIQVIQQRGAKVMSVLQYNNQFVVHLYIHEIIGSRMQEAEAFQDTSSKNKHRL